MLSKKSIRKDILCKRASQAHTDEIYKSNRIKNILLESTMYKDAKTVCVYVSYNHEVDTKELIKRCLSDGKKVAVPKTNTIDKTMEFFYIDKFEDLEEGSYGILEPKGNELMNDNLCLMIIPLVAFDKYKNRLGYGGGFYDKYLASHSFSISVALAYDLQMVDELSSDIYDISPDIILTETKVYR